MHLRQRLGLEADYEERVFRFGTHFFHLENWYSVHAVIRNSLRVVGLHGRGRRNARAVVLRENEVALEGLPGAFDGYRVLHISDPHVDMSEDITDAMIERVRGLDYDLCVMTGDYRARTFGPYQPTLDAMARLRAHLSGTIVAVLGNHDTIRMVPGLEAMGIRVLLNESMALARGTPRSTSRGSTTRTTTGSTTSKRRRRGSRQAPSASCCPTRRRPTSTPVTPVSG